MAVKHYNNLECNYAFSLINTDVDEALIAYQEYIKKYPDDFRAYPFYSYVLIIKGELELAQKVLDESKNRFLFNNFYKGNNTKNFVIFRNFHLNQLRILACEKRYQDVLDYYKKYKMFFVEDRLDVLLFYCRKKLGILSNKEISGKQSYIHRQIVDYNEEEFINHVYDYHGSDKEDVSVTFNYDFPIERIVEEVKKYIPSEKALHTGFYDDKYIFKYDYCGRIDNKGQDYFSVFCFPGTKELITMFPSKEGEYLPHVDLNYLYEDNKEVKSQIDKFREKYSVKK